MTAEFQKRIDFFKKLEVLNAPKEVINFFNQFENPQSVEHHEFKDSVICVKNILEDTKNKEDLYFEFKDLEIKFYRKNSDYFDKTQFDKEGNPLYTTNNKSFVGIKTFDENNNEITYENSKGYKAKRTYDKDSNELTFENNKGYSHKREWKDGIEVNYEMKTDEK